jgi:hypothetical protein
MPSAGHLRQVARDLKRELNNHAFLTLPRREITERIRNVSGEDATRMKVQMAAEMERALLEQGVRCHPALDNTTTGDVVRLFHAGTMLGHLVDLIEYPSSDDDAELGAIIRKVKGKWDFAGPGLDEAEVSS